jgi:hypothetical protein
MTNAQRVVVLFSSFSFLVLATALGGAMATGWTH